MSAIIFQRAWQPGPPVHEGGQHGSIAVIERLVLTFKQTLAWLARVPLRRHHFHLELVKLT